jgi:hypothetical protein
MIGHPFDVARPTRRSPAGMLPDEDEDDETEPDDDDEDWDPDEEEDEPEEDDEETWYLDFEPGS